MSKSGKEMSSWYGWFVLGNGERKVGKIGKVVNLSFIF